MSYALIVHSKEVLGQSGKIMTQAGERFWVLVEKEGWVKATSVRHKDSYGIPEDIKVFDTPESAIKFAQKWEGHPWWCDPDHAHYEVVKIKTRYKQVFDGYDYDNEDVPLS